MLFTILITRNCQTLLVRWEHYESLWIIHYTEAKVKQKKSMDHELFGWWIITITSSTGLTCNESWYVHLPMVDLIVILMFNQFNSIIQMIQQSSINCFFVINTYGCGWINIHVIASNDGRTFDVHENLVHVIDIYWI